MIYWPSDLPYCVLGQGYEEGTQDGRIRTPNEGPIAKMRRRYTKKTNSFNVAQCYTKEQCDIFDDFYDNTLEAGTQAFQWQHPRNENPASVRIVKRATFTYNEGKYLAKFQIEIIPS